MWQVVPTELLEKKYLRLALGWNRVYLKLVGIWPEPTATEHVSSSCKALTAILLLTIFIILPQTTNLFMLNGDLDQITNNLCLGNIPTINTVGKILVTWYYREGLKPLVQSFYDDWLDPKTEEERTTMLNRAKVSRFISTWCAVLTQAMVMAYLSLRAVTIYACDQDQQPQDHLLIYHGYFPYNVRPTSVLVLTNVGQALAGLCAAVPYTSVDAFICMLVLHTCSQFENLRMRLERLMDEENETKSVDHTWIQTELVSIVRRHEHLNWVANRIEEYFNVLLLVQVMLCTIEMCFQGFLFFNFVQHTEEGIWNFQLVFFVLFVNFIVVHMYIYCYVGEMLLVQSNGMAISAYNSSWFNVAPQEAKCLLFIMNRSIRPLRLTAGKFGTFSIEMFSAILRTAMGYLSVLLTVQAGKG
ncbi:odorant receptor 13a-like [Andrena cerasifolii]|uniref:odorant receptor 13a-like n=1 Tax=Andrena cerasifolii TaxID=2819439 RepID=UPI0040377C6B